MYRRILDLFRGRRKVQALALALLFAAAGDAAYYAVVCRPVRAEAAALQSRSDELERLNARASENVRRYSEFLEGKRRLDEFKSMLASRPEYTDVLKKVYRLAKKDKMKFSSFAAQTSALRQVGDLEQLSFSLPVSGRYPDVRKFIYDVETSDLFLNINDLGLTGGGKEDITLTIGLSTYVRS